MENTKKYVPYQFYWDKAPIDLSFMFKDEKPAGKHGFMKAAGERFEFDDGTIVRFWGTNFNSGANFPEHEDAKIIASRLAKFGINIVRFHQLDADWSIPNLFQFTRGARPDNTMELDPVSMDRLDWLIYCLKNEGIYVYLDLLTYRKFRSGDLVENADKLADAAKPYCVFDRRLIELQKKFCHDIWTHNNPYTGLEYRNEPAIVMTEIANETDLWTRITLEPYKSDFDKRFSLWCEGRKEKDVDPEELMLEFKTQLMRNYFIEMRDYLINLGVKVPIAGTNWGNLAGTVVSQEEMDFYDSHGYWLDKTWTFWGEEEKRLYDQSIFDHKGVVYPMILLGRVLGKPFVVSEWDEPWPIEWRAESVPYLAAVSGLQGWSGVIIHTYRYGTNKNIDRLGKEMSSSAIGGVPYREGLFSTFNDPAKFGLFYHAAIMTRRGDVEEAKKSISLESKSLKLVHNSVPAFSSPFDEKHKIGMKLCDSHKAGDVTLSAEKDYSPEFEGYVRSDTAQIYRSFEDKNGYIDTPRTKIVYGFFNDKAVDISGLSVEIQNDFAVIAISSLDGNDIDASENILVTTIARAENTGMVFDEQRRKMLDVGNAPICIETVMAKIRIKTKVDGLRVLSINPEGFITGTIPSEHIDSRLEFSTGKKLVSMYYLIQKV